jgi:putative oxidoreductase
VLGTMLVALVTNHVRNGFFIFRPGEGYEYVLMISVVSVALAGIGGGWLSIDHAIGLPITGTTAFVVCLAPGVGSAAVTLVTAWRPRQVVSARVKESSGT